MKRRALFGLLLAPLIAKIGSVFGKGKAPAPSAPLVNPADILLDVLQRSGWPDSELNLRSFDHAARFCEETTPTYDQAATVARAVLTEQLNTHRAIHDVRHFS